MRVISGRYKGRKLIGFDINGTRPTMDRVKESLFGIIQNKIKNSICLDLFSGSGSLGLEALSNGASKCYFIDNNKEIIKILQKNLENIDGCIIINSDYKKYLKNCEEKFDIIFLDPPYKLNLVNKCIELILKNDLLNDGGIIVVEYENEKIDCELELLKSKKYGSKNIKIYQK